MKDLFEKYVDVVPEAVVDRASEENDEPTAEPVSKL